jgi:hypothetical protein
MDEFWKKILYAFLVLRGLIDLFLVFLSYLWTGSFETGALVLILCCVPYIFLFFGIRNEQFPGRYGHKVIFWREPAAYWFVFAFLVLLHLVFSFMIVQLSY